VRWMTWRAISAMPYRSEYIARTKSVTRATMATVHEGQTRTNARHIND
jgi:hypothetical protein